MRVIDEDWGRRIFELFEKLRADPGKVEQLELDTEDDRATGHARRLAELEAAVRRIEALLSGGSQGGEKPPAKPPGGGHGGHSGGHEH